MSSRRCPAFNWIRRRAELIETAGNLMASTWIPSLRMARASCCVLASSPSQIGTSVVQGCHAFDEISLIVPQTLLPFGFVSDDVEGRRYHHRLIRRQRRGEAISGCPCRKLNPADD